MQLRTFITLLVTAMAVSAAIASTPVISFPMEMNDDKEVTETVSGNTYTVRGKHGESVPAVVGYGLRTDGYSSFVQVPMSSYTLSSQTLSISFWTACQTYPMMVLDVAENKEAAIISCLDATSKTGFAFFLYSQGRYGFSCYVNGQKKNLATTALFPQYEWVNLTATIDAVNGYIALYKNGEEVASQSFSGSINLPTGNLYIGKSSVDVKSGQFYLNTYNGIIDELNIYNEILPASEIPTALSAKPNLNLPISHYDADLTRPRHHAMPASNWMNESHGMTYANGKYHLFFQKNGNGPYMSRLHWGHVSSEDLCNWHEEPIAIVPGKAYDLKGCWSGCVFTDQTITQGEPWILYTGVDNGRATINLATPADDDLEKWNKSNKNPVINGTPSGYSADFRDPYFFRSGNNAYCIVGTSRDGVASTSLHKYNNTSGKFDYTGDPFFTGSNTSDCGTFFEMPNITPMPGNKWLFTATPLATANGVRTIYYVGTINSDGTFRTTQASPKTVELSGMARDGYGLLSPTIYQKDGKTIALGIVPDKLATSANYQVGWAHTVSFPREWSIDAQGELVQKPYSGLEALRSSTTVSKGSQTLNGELSLAPVEGFEVEVVASFKVGTVPFGIKLLHYPNGAACKVFYNPQNRRFTIEYSSSVYTSELPATIAQGSTMKIHLFLDHSVLDVFINDRWASSVRIFPTSAASKGVTLFSEGATQLISASAWTMKPFQEDETEPVIDAIEEIARPASASTSMVIRDGHFLILQGDKIYNALGVRIR